MMEIDAMKRLFLTFIIALVSTGAFAQTITPRDNFLWDLDYYNPAVFTRPQGIYADLYGRYDINPVKNLYTNPLDLVAEIKAVRKDHIWQASLAHDYLSYMDVTQANFGYTHGWEFGNGNQHRINFGGRLMIGVGRLDYSKLDYGENGYKIFCLPDIDVGFEYRYKFFHTGLSFRNVFSYPMKDTYEKDEKGKPLGSVYMRYPRAGIWHMLFDIDFCDNCSMYPFLALGMNQNAFVELGTGLKFFKNYRFNYSFHGPQLSHNFGFGVDICNRVHIGASYCFSPTVYTQAVTMRVSVRLAD